MALGPRQLGLAPEEVNRRVEEALVSVHLRDRADDDPFSLTKGQRQCLAVAGVLALAPGVIILDEPTTGLDFREQEDLLDLVSELHAQGRTIIMVTHSMWAAATYARRLVVLKDGRVLLDGPTREVLAQEEILSEARLRPPAVVRLSRRLGFLALTPQEFRERIEAEGIIRNSPLYLLTQNWWGKGRRAQPKQPINGGVGTHAYENLPLGLQAPPSHLNI